MFSFFLAEKWNIIKYVLLLAEPEIFVGQVKCIKQKFNRKNIAYYISILHRFCLNLLSLLTINSSFYFIISYSNLILLATISLSSYFLYKFLATLFPPPPPQSIPRSAHNKQMRKKKLSILDISSILFLIWWVFLSSCLLFFTLMFLFNNIYLIAASNLHITI